MSSTPNASKDGWSRKPSGWNQFDQVISLEGHHWTNDELAKYSQIDYIVVLAGGLDHLGRNHTWVTDRLDLAIHLYRLKKRKILMLGGGTYHKPPLLNREHFVLHESTIGAKYLIDHGVDSGMIYREWASYDTIANGFFCLTNFFLPLGIKKALVITSDFHMPRGRRIFQWMAELVSNRMEIELEFLEVSSEDLDTEIIEARKSREARSLLKLEELISKIRDLESFHHWFYTEHKAYNCQFGGGEKLDQSALKSY